MFTTITNFVAEWEKEAELTVQVLNGLTDESLQRRIDADRRTLGALAWHLVTSIDFMTSLGLDFEGVDEGAKAPESAGGIAEAYRHISRALLEAVKTQWTDDNLLETRALAREEWRNGDLLRFSLIHQAHHRGQMTVLMRQAGLRPPEIYGPTYETWVEKGKTPLD
ncbi:DinB family protein [Paenibacillus tyrfis]|uniref:Damage-inducible protein DinB n=1 Tax=Paenibacillus tyrfis TaxID=1501230 RepID=A0A081P0A3_9BACL|nr:DinB family protein [Paenibacillus tyrfis]KEQ24126.1 hypothetical protein ET33_10495 [Paenibacillus tyrfis]